MTLMEAKNSLKNAPNYEEKERWLNWNSLK